MRTPVCREIEHAIDDYLAAQRAALDDPGDRAGFWTAPAITLQVWRTAERRLIRSLRGMAEAYSYRGYRWQIDPFGELTKFPDDSVLSMPRGTNNRRIV